MHHEHQPITSLESLMPLREAAVEALRPFASVGDPVLLDLQDDAVEMALQKVDTWEKEAQQSARTDDERLAAEVLATSLYVKAGFHNPAYLEEVYLKLQDMLFDHLERDPSPYKQHIIQVMQDTQAFIREIMEEQGQSEALDQAIRVHEGLDQVSEEEDPLDEVT